LAPPPDSRPRHTNGSDESILAAIDVGTNAIRLEIARPSADGSLETLHQERDAVRPGEGVFTTGEITKDVADRLLSTLRRYGALCRRFGATTRAVATSALRESRNREAIVRRARDEAGLELEIVSGREEARLICLGVLQGKAAQARSLVVDIGGGSTEVAFAIGERPVQLWSVSVGAVRLTEIFEASGKVSPAKLEIMRRFADEAFREAIPRWDRSMPRTAVGSSGTINTVVRYAASEGTVRATEKQITQTTEAIAEMPLNERRRIFDSKRAEIIVAGAVVLEAVMKHLRLQSITGVDRGLRDGVLVDLWRRSRASPQDSSLSDAAIAMGRRLDFDEGHARQVARLALALFDRLALLHNWPAPWRRLLEVAALLHDIGHTINPQRHHKHTHYLIQNADLPGLTDRERELVGLIARFHRRSAPERNHPLLAVLPPSELNAVRKLSVVLRMADSLDRSHQQAIRSMKVSARPRELVCKLATRAPVDLELWDAEREAALFRRVLGRNIVLTTSRK
jgi:exopolyphosphatase/guanosine-5'-triphosphate,3'-diphosphate pyrophosphatase